MTLAQSLQNMLVLLIPVFLYGLLLSWRSNVTLSEIGNRLGIRLATGRPYLFALAIAIPASFMAAWSSELTSNFKGSMLAPYVGAPPTLVFIASTFYYGLIATGFPEELLFRGLVGGALFRRMSFWQANFLQSFIFMLPHLLIIFIAPQLWPVAIAFPIILGLANGWLLHTSGSILPGVIVHALPNMIGALSVLNWATF
jgi:membrane protease YdiL (CAAX protease family)